MFCIFIELPLAATILPPRKLYTSMPMMYKPTVTQPQPRSSYDNPVHQTQEPIFQPVIGPEGEAILGLFLYGNEVSVL